MGMTGDYEVVVEEGATMVRVGTGILVYDKVFNRTCCFDTQTSPYVRQILHIEIGECKMSLLGKLMDTMRLSPEEEEDDYYLDDDFEEEAPRKGLFTKKGTEYEDEEESDKPRFLGRSNPKVVPMRRSMEVTMIKPTSMEDSRDISDYLLAGKAVVLNMEGIHTEVAQRIIDFTSGATYSMNGNLQKISNYIFIATPDSVELSGDFQDILAAGGAMGMDVSGLNIRL